MLQPNAKFCQATPACEAPCNWAPNRKKNKLPETNRKLGFVFEVIFYGFYHGIRKSPLNHHFERRCFTFPSLPNSFWWKFLGVQTPPHHVFGSLGFFQPTQQANPGKLEITSHDMKVFDLVVAKTHATRCTPSYWPYKYYRWWFQICIFIPIWGMIQFYWYFSSGLVQPPTRIHGFDWGEISPL